MSLRLWTEFLQTFTVLDGLWQGDCWSALCFSLALARAIRGFREDMSAAGLWVRLVAYLDDLVLVLRRGGLGFAAVSLEKWLRSVGLTLEKSKSL